MAFLLDRTRRQTHRHHPESGRHLQTARRRSVYLSRRCAPARRRAPRISGCRTDATALETAIRWQSAALRPRAFLDALTSSALPLALRYDSPLIDWRYSWRLELNRWRLPQIRECRLPICRCRYRLRTSLPAREATIYPYLFTERAAFTVFEKLANFGPVSWGAVPADDFAKFPHFRFSDEAQAVFNEWMGDLHSARISNEDEPIIRQHLAK